MIRSVRTMTISSLWAVLLSISAYIAINLPYTSVSFTTQSLMVMIIGLTMPSSVAGLSLSIYLMLGVIGLPVFSMGQAGLSVLLGPTGGYLIGFWMGAIVIAWLRSRIGKFLAVIIGGIVVVYGFGIMGLMIVLRITFSKAFLIGALPFIPLDLIKASLAYGVSKRYSTFFQNMKLR